jgi:hypothetical protein
MALAAPLGALTGRRRYRCAGCGWRGWKHPLRRRNNAVSIGGRGTADKPAIAFVSVFALTLVIASLILARGCEPPPTPDIISFHLPPE